VDPFSDDETQNKAALVPMIQDDKSWSEDTLKQVVASEETNWVRLPPVFAEFMACPSVTEDGEE
jgi:hypothetical protein